MNNQEQIQPFPAVASAVGAIGISTALYSIGFGTASSLPLITAPLLAVLIYSGSLVLWGKLESVKQWLIGLGVMLGVQLSLGLLTGIMFFFAKPSVAQSESMRWAVIGYGPGIMLQVMATVAICHWVPKLLNAAQPPKTLEVPRSYESQDLNATIQKTMHYRAEMMERISNTSRQIAEEKMEQEREIETQQPESVFIQEDDQLLTPSVSAEDPTFSIENAGHRYRLMNGKLIEDNTPDEPVLIEQEIPDEPEGLISYIVKEIPWTSTEPGEPELRIRATSIIPKLPKGSVAIPQGESEIWLKFPQRHFIPQLAEGIVWAPADLVLNQFPPSWFLRPAGEIVASLEEGYLELPLKDVIDQMPWSVFARPNQRSAPELPGREWGTLFKEAMTR